MGKNCKYNPIAARCFDHLGGKLSTELMNTFLRNKWIIFKENRTSVFEITEFGFEQLEKIGVDITKLQKN